MAKIRYYYCGDILALRRRTQLGGVIESGGSYFVLKKDIDFGKRMVLEAVPRNIPGDWPYFSVS